MPAAIINIAPPPVLQDPALQQELDREGAVQFPFLSPEALEELTAFYHKMHPTVPEGPIKGFYVSSHSSDVNYKIAIQNEIQKIITPFIAKYMHETKLINSAILIKSAAPISELGLHQDWTVVDETKYAGYGLWIPLVDATEQNGTISFIYRSHRIGPTYRHVALPSIYSNINTSIAKYLKPMPVKAGHAILFNQAVLHYSAHNLSPIARPAIINIVTSTQAQHIMYAQSQTPDLLDIYSVKDDYMQHYQSFFEDSLKVPADAQKIGTQQTDHRPITIEEFDYLYHQLQNQ